MVLSTENKYYTITNIMADVKISRFFKEPTIAYIHQHLLKTKYFQMEHWYDI